jgi:transglutaminase-like putative cysteine protease
MHSPSRTLRVRHVTRYTYEAPVTRSVHRLHVRPITDWRQRVLCHTLAIEPDAPRVEYEDVFGNWSTRFEITHPYTELTIAAESVVEVADADPFACTSLPIRPASYPLVWMPWERTMLAPYLTPVELPDTQLQDLTDYAMSMVQRNNFDLMETLFAINLSLFHDFQYVPGCTTLDTTPYQVFLTRRGVCQDFANLFITLARLLGIPARYVCGYLYTGNTHRTRAQSDASHAWVQLYIPHIGWKDFDPTNGVLPQTDHVRVAYGRHFRDATPTTGTLYGNSKETMHIDLTVEDATPEPVEWAPA